MNGPLFSFSLSSLHSLKCNVFNNFQVRQALFRSLSVMVGRNKWNDVLVECVCMCVCGGGGGGGAWCLLELGLLLPPEFFFVLQSMAYLWYWLISREQQHDQTTWATTLLSAASFDTECTIESSLVVFLCWHVVFVAHFVAWCWCHC